MSLNAPPKKLLGNRLARNVLALILGSVGGALFSHFNVPLAWTIGALTFTTVAALSGVPIERPRRLWMVMVAILGVMMGCGFSPDTLRQAGQWLTSIGILLVYSIAATAVAFAYLYRLKGYSPATAFFCASPGGFLEMLMLGMAMGGDERAISLIHSLRITVTVITIPIWFRIFHGYEPGGLSSVLGKTLDVSAGDASILALCAVIGYGLAHKLKIPAAPLIGPMVLSAAAHLGGITQARPPVELVAVAQVVVGVNVGCRFTGVAVRQVMGILFAGAVMTLLMLATAMVFSLLVESLTDIPFPTLVLAFAPGGMVEMSLVTLALGVDIAFVSTHHLIRLLFLMAVIPVVSHLMRGFLRSETGK